MNAFITVEILQSSVQAANRSVAPHVRSNRSVGTSVGMIGSASTFLPLFASSKMVEASNCNMPQPASALLELDLKVREASVQIRGIDKPGRIEFRLTKPPMYSLVHMPTLTPILYYVPH